MGLIVNLYKELLNALNSEGRGLEMLRIMKEAAAAGIGPGEAIQALKRLYLEATDAGREEDANLVCEVYEIPRGHCHSEDRIWPVEETLANEEKETREGTYW
jgi:hypothetical protein